MSDLIHGYSEGVVTRPGGKQTDSDSRGGLHSGGLITGNLDAPRKEQYYHAHLAASLNESRAQRKQIIDEALGRQPDQPGVAILGAVGRGNKFALPGRGQPDLPQQGDNGGSEATALAFALYDASSGGTLKVGILFGNVNPTGAMDSGVNAWPNVFSAGGSWLYSFSVSASGTCWIEVDIDATAFPYAVSAITIGYGASTPANTSTKGYFTLGNWTVASGVLTIVNGTAGVGNLTYQFCGGTHNFYN